MTKEQRTAIARIISDMIKADNIIEQSEMRSMKDIMANYNITRQEMSDSRLMQFSDAIKLLQTLSQRERKKLFDKIYALSISDGVCAPREAMLLLALEYCLLPKNIKPYIISCATSDMTINDRYMIYLESSYDEKRNSEIENNLRLLVTLSKLCGFSFVYMPKMVEEFKKMDEEYVKDVLAYMAPNLEDSYINDIYDRLCTITTSTFVKNVLQDKLRVKFTQPLLPSILVNIGTFVIPFCGMDSKVQYYTEFLCLPIRDNTLGLVDEVLSFYQSKVSIHQSITIQENQGQFKYFGFYKALFDFLIAPPPVEPDLIFAGQDMHSARFKVVFRFGEQTKTIFLTPKEYDTYLDVAKYTHSHARKGLPIGELRTTLGPRIAHIRAKISKEIPELTNKDDYIPVRVRNMYKLVLSKDKLFINKPIGGEDNYVPLV